MFKPFPFASALLAAACLASCANLSTQVERDGITYTHSVDKSGGAVSDRIGGAFNLPGGGLDPDMHYMRFTLERKEAAPAMAPAYTLTLSYSDVSALPIGPGKTLILSLDGGKTISLDGPGSAGKGQVDVDTARWWESASYAVTRGQLMDIAAAQNVDARLIGTHREATASMKDDSLQRLAKFLKLFPDAPAALSPTASSGAGAK